MSSLTFRERMSGWVTFGEDDYNEGLRCGRADGTACAIDLSITVADVDAFLTDENREASATGTVRCGALGGTLDVEAGRFNLFVRLDDRPGWRRMLYVLRLRDHHGRPLTLSGFKEVADGMGLDVWSDTSTLFVGLRAGHAAGEADVPGATQLAAGVLRISPLGFGRVLASMRARGGAPWQRATALARFGRAFAGTLLAVYGGRALGGDRPDFPDPAHPAGDPFRGQTPGAWHDLDGHAGLRRRIVPLRAEDGLELTLHNVRGAADPTAAPVLCLHGTGVRGDLFLGAPGGVSVARALVDAGHDVWISNWRASIDLPPRPYTLDDAAVFDHPAAIAEVRRLTEEPSVRVLAHCQGSTSFTMTALAGLAADVTHVVASAVSLHTVVPRATRIKGRFMLPLLGLRMPYVSAQWAIRSPTLLAAGFARLARAIRRECDSPVCALGNYMYGTGPDVLWVHDRLGPRAHDWISREFGFAPYRFLEQMQKCTSAGHLVPTGELAALPRDLLTAPVPAGQRWTFIAGRRNRLYLPVGQQRSHAHWTTHGEADAGHALHVLDGYGHLDPLLGPDAERQVFPKIVAALAD